MYKATLYSTGFVRRYEKIIFYADDQETATRIIEALIQESNLCESLTVNTEEKTNTLRYWSEKPKEMLIGKIEEVE